MEESGTVCDAQYKEQTIVERLCLGLKDDDGGDALLLASNAADPERTHLTSEISKSGFCNPFEIPRSQSCKNYLLDIFDGACVGSVKLESNTCVEFVDTILDMMRMCANVYTSSSIDVQEHMRESLSSFVLYQTDHVKACGHLVSIYEPCMSLIFSVQEPCDVNSTSLIPAYVSLVHNLTFVSVDFVARVWSVLLENRTADQIYEFLNSFLR